MSAILLVDDEIKLLKILQSSLEKKGFTVFAVSNGNDAIKILRKEQIDVVFLDLMLPNTTGIELLQQFVPQYPNKVFVVMTAYGNIESAVAAMKAGAFDYITKPAKLDEMLIVIQRAFDWLGIKEENQYLKERLQETLVFQEVIGNSSSMEHIYQLIERVSATDATVLLEGESGTGKSLLAKIIHRLSERNTNPFVTVNCAAIPDQLLESEIFGYDKGAFTGATTSRKGKFEAANGGTIFLDEIGEINASLQAKLLQVTQEKTFMRLGSNTLRQVDVRIIAATNRSLKKMVKEGLFREDLYYRLNIVDIIIPTLRERKEDIPLLIEKFLDKHRKKNNKNYQISKELLNQLMEYEWPGNVREVENAVERAVVLCRSENLSLDDFPRKIQESKITEHQVLLDGFPNPLPIQLDQIEKEIIEQALQSTNGHAAKAARKLGISRQSLLYKMNKYGIANKNE